MKLEASPTMAVLCPECDTPLELDADLLDEGEVVTCEECGADLEITTVEPLQVVLVDVEGYDDEDLGRTDDEEDE